MGELPLLFVRLQRLLDWGLDSTRTKLTELILQMQPKLPKGQEELPDFLFVTHSLLLPLDRRTQPNFMAKDGKMFSLLNDYSLKIKIIYGKIWNMIAIVRK